MVDLLGLDPLIHLDFATNRQRSVGSNAKLFVRGDTAGLHLARDMNKFASFEGETSSAPTETTMLAPSPSAR